MNKFDVKREEIRQSLPRKIQRQLFRRCYPIEGIESGARAEFANMGGETINAREIELHNCVADNAHVTLTDATLYRVDFESSQCILDSCTVKESDFTSAGLVIIGGRLENCIFYSAAVTVIEPAIFINCDFSNVGALIKHRLDTYVNCKF